MEWAAVRFGSFRTRVTIESDRSTCIQSLKSTCQQALKGWTKEWREWHARLAQIPRDLKPRAF